MRLLVFGDSIAQGMWDVDGGWIARLRKQYDEKMISTGAAYSLPTVFNLGVSGDTSDEILHRFAGEVSARQWPGEELIIVLATGVNDSRIDGDQPLMSPDHYRHNLEQFISQSRAFSDKLLFVGLTPCIEAKTTPVQWGDDVSFTEERIQMFDDCLKDVARMYQIPFVDILQPFKTALSHMELLPDCLHPNAAGHELLCDAVSPAIATHSTT